MKAPDKIYFYSYCGDIDTATWDVEPFNGENVEYIRKDALLEWAKEQHKILMEMLDPLKDDFGWGTRFAFHLVIDKINSL